MRRPRPLLLLALALLLTGCGGAAPLADRQAPYDSSSVVRMHEPEPVVVFDGVWPVRDGRWDVVTAGFPPPVSSRPGRHLLAADQGSGSVGLHGPLQEGDYEVRVELHLDEPAVPPACQDVVEADLFRGGRAVEMVSAGRRAGPWVQPGADSRLRWCASGLDELDRDGPGTGVRARQLLQLWPVSRDQPVTDVRLGSRFAHALSGD